MSNETKITKVVEIDLGNRVIDIDGNYFTGKVKVIEALADELKKRLAAPVKHTVDLAHRVVNINGTNYTGIVSSEHEGFIAELRYRLGMQQTNEARIGNAKVNPNQFRENAAGRSVIEINGANYVKVGA